MTCPVSILNGGELHVYAHMPKTHPLIKDRDWCRPSHVTFVSFPSSFSLTTRSALNNSSFGSPADGQRRIVAPTVLCIGGVTKQNKMAIEAENLKQICLLFYSNRKCCCVPLPRLVEAMVVALGIWAGSCMTVLPDPVVAVFVVDGADECCGIARRDLFQNSNAEK